MGLRDIVKKHSPESVGEDCWDQEYCPAEDCISCDNVDCILHPGDGDD